MCGIAGIAGRPDTALIHAMTDALAHRGPDGEGHHVDGDIALGHRRLAILDRAGGAQPMAYGGGRYWMTYNGEVYNFQALRAELEAHGHAFTTRSDTEVVLAAYAHWGEACIGKLRGMFAFALWDSVEKRLFLARDPVGVKPLYYAET
ncbi:MAG TPA: asparagine synthetase B, partial [Candidatus Hydrogenedentes bacterium]|nr:asparagine synthetase B [Candidatus Hydrogenedentota bacterium]